MITKLNKAFESRVRLGIMSALLVNEELDFNSLKHLLDVSDGNLASHLSALETLKFIDVEKKFVGRKTNTTYGITRIGRKAFNEHIDALELIIRKNR
jgi:DNA-binding HxlR family transcriptional regulator